MAFQKQTRYHQSADYRGFFERNQAAINREISEINTLDDLLRYFKYAAQIVKTAPMFRKFLFFVMYQMEWSEGLFNTLNISGPINQIINF